MPTASLSVVPGSRQTLEQRIHQDLVHRIRSGNPGSLTLEDLGSRYQSSTRPVRAALARLVEDGLLVKLANRRLEVAPGTRPTRGWRSAPPAPPRDHGEVIAADLVKASLRGEELFLREEPTAARYGIGRTVLRRLFLELAGKGLLEHVARRGWRVRPFRQADLDAFLEVREVLELKALDLAKDRLERTQLESMLAGNAIDRHAGGERVRLDNRIHGYLIERSGNPYLRDFFARQGAYFALFFDWEAGDRGAAREACHQHRALLRALIARDWPAARARLTEHIRHTHPVLRTSSPGGVS